jgi:hypothetical protein
MSKAAQRPQRRCRLVAPGGARQLLDRLQVDGRVPRRSVPPGRGGSRRNQGHQGKRSRPGSRRRRNRSRNGGRVRLQRALDQPSRPTRATPRLARRAPTVKPERCDGPELAALDRGPRARSDHERRAVTTRPQPGGAHHRAGRPGFSAQQRHQRREAAKATSIHRTRLARERQQRHRGEPRVGRRGGVERRRLVTGRTRGRSPPGDQDPAQLPEAPKIGRDQRSRGNRDRGDHEENRRPRRPTSHHGRIGRKRLHRRQRRGNYEPNRDLQNVEH